MFHSLNYFDTLIRISICVINYNVVCIDLDSINVFFFKFSVLPQLNAKTNNFKNIVAAKEKKSDPVLFIVLTVEYISLQSNNTHKHTRKYIRWWNCFAKKNDFFPLYRTEITSNNLTEFSLRRKISKQFF